VFKIRCLFVRLSVVVMLLGFGLSGFGPITPARAQSGEDFQIFLQKIKQQGLSRGFKAASLDHALSGLTLDNSVIALTQRQSEFTKPIWSYLNDGLGGGRIDKGKALLAQHKALFEKAEKRFGVDRGVMLGIWGMESNFGGFSGDKDVIRSLASLAFVGYRGQFFANELMIALELIDKGQASREVMKGSWAGAMGQTQFMPSSFKAYAIDFDGDGHKNIWTNLPDIIGSTANYLAAHGWVAGLPWGFEITLPQHYSYALTEGEFASFAKQGVKRADGKPMPQKGHARLFFPAGSTGPVFLITKNFDMIRAYNASDAYALTVAHLGDRIKGGQPFMRSWPVNEPQLSSEQRVEFQERLQALGYDVGEIDGRIGSKTRNAWRQEQIKRGLIPDGWPSQRALATLRN
jgi:membrane-bound lytic murein transglycosylase B